MKRNILLLTAAATMLLLSHCTSNTGSGNSEAGQDTAKKEMTAMANDPGNLCIVTPSWFPHSQTPPPAEGKGSPFDTSSTTNQIFHQWSWNKFLWLTKPDKNGNPLFLTSADIKQVTTYMAPVPPPAGTMLVLQDIAQAGSGSPILQSNPAYGGKSETAYYAIYMNNLMYQSGVQFADQIIKGQLPPANTAMFPVGSFELKTAWIPVTTIPAAKQSMYYTTMASLSADGGKTFTNTKVALIGMHVVGVVENHPEFIWATFEHQDLSPNYNWSTNSASAAADMLAFRQGQVSGINGIRFNTATKLGMKPYQIFDLFQYGVPRDSSGNFMVTAQGEPINFNNVQGINKCVQGKLDDVWKNYFYNGSIWLNMDGKTPEQQAQLIDSLRNSISNATPGSAARGSMNCANVTMESFTQTFQSDIKGIKVTNLANCFSCHKGVSFDPAKYVSPLYLSHTFQDYLQQKKGVPVKQVEDLKTKDEIMTLKRLSGQ